MNASLEIQQQQHQTQQQQHDQGSSNKPQNYFSNIQLLEGLHDEERNRPFMCTVCSATYKTRTHLRRHMFVHLSSRPYPCSDCGKGFNRKEHLNKHIEAVHSGTKYECGFCGKEISRKDHLNRHIKNMHSSVHCSLNGNNTSSAAGLSGEVNPSGIKVEHQTVSQHTQQQQSLVGHPDNMIKVNLPCALKQKAQLSFLTPNQQGNHQNSNVKSKAKSSSQFKSKGNQGGGSSGAGSNLTQLHQSLTSDMKNVMVGPGGTNKKFIFQVYNCTECNSTFTTEKDYNIHSRTHKPQPYKCSECPRAYTRREKLTEHIRCFHQGQKFTCDYCHKALSRKDHVLRHVRSVHPEVLANRFVSMAEDMDTQSRLLNFNSSSSLATSSPSSGGTSHAGSSSSTASALGEMNILLRSVCHICLKVFGTSYHLSRHIESCHNGDIRPYNCTACSKQFKRKDHLTKHMKSHCPSYKKMKELESSNMDAIDSLQILMSSPEDDQVIHQGNGKNTMDLNDLFTPPGNHVNGSNCKSHGNGVVNQNMKIDVNQFFNVDSNTNMDNLNNINSLNVTMYPCGHCGKEFTDRNRLIQHLQEHSSADIIGKPKSTSSTNNHNLQVNQNKLDMNQIFNVDNNTNNISMYPCGHCQKEFTDKNRLIQHLQEHSGTDIIGKPKPSPSTNNHNLQGNQNLKIDVNQLFTVDNATNNMTMYPCGHCGKEFTDRNRLIQHLQEHSGTDIPGKPKSTPSTNNHNLQVWS